MDKVLDSYNCFVGGIIAFFSMIFGPHWFLFAAFLLLNVIDWITGWMKARLMHVENSVKGWTGVAKKLGYWLLILVAFITCTVFIEVGQTLGVNLQVTQLLPYFVLATLLVNEIRSILENFVEAGIEVPQVLIKGLEVADKMIEKDE